MKLVAGSVWVERGVEYGYLFHAGKDFFDGKNTFQVGRIVQRSDLEQRADLLLDLFGYQTSSPGKIRRRALRDDRTAFTSSSDRITPCTGRSGLKHQLMPVV